MSARKIIHIVEATATGTLSMASLLANTQAEAGHDVYVIYSLRPETPVNFCKEFSSSIKLYQIPMYKYNDKLKAAFSLRKYLIENSPHSIFMHSSFAGFLGRLAGLGLKSDISFFYIPHCISLMRQDIGFFRKGIFLLFEWIGALKDSDYIAVSMSEKIIVEKYIPFRKCHLVENAVFFNKESNLKKRNGNLIVTVGQIRHQKDPLEFAKISMILQKKCSEIQMVWIGDGDPYLRKLLEDSGVRVTGWLKRDDVLSLLSKSTIYLSTAKWEGMPVSIIEANYSGIPVVASRCAGNVDVVSHGVTGWVYDSIDDAVRLIQSALADIAGSINVARYAQKSAKKRFSIERYVNEMNAILEK